MANLLVNGDFSASSGFGASSIAGPGWATDYIVPSGGNLFSGPGAGAARWAFFTTNASQVTNGSFAGVPALGGRSMAVNVGPNLTQDIIRWTGIHLVNNATYRLSVEAAVLFFPYSVAMYIDGSMVMALSAPVSSGVWTQTASEFVWTGATGLHTVSLRSNNTAAGGNDHAFDNFFLERVEVLPVPGCCTAAMACYRDVSPCNAVPTQSTSSQTATFDSATITNRSAFSVSGPTTRLHDLNYSGLGGHLVFNCGSAPNQLVDADIDLFFATPRDNITSFRVFHGYGSILNDCDGMGPGSFVTAFDAADNVLAGPVAMVTGNSGAGWVTPLPGAPLNGVARVRVTPLQRHNCGVSTGIGIREMEMIAGYTSTLTWSCGGTVIEGIIQGAQAGITVAGGNLTQTNGPHTITFQANQSGFVGTITTNNPGNFDKLVVSDADPVLTVTGNGTSTFSISWELVGEVRRAIVDLGVDPPTWTDMETSVEMVPGTFTPVACG